MRSPKPSAAVREVLCRALYVSPPFLGGIVALALSLAGLVDLHPRLFERDILILNLLLYWAITAALAATILNARAVFCFVSTHRLPILTATAASVLSLCAAEFVARFVVERSHGFHLVGSSLLHHQSPPNVDLIDNTGSSVRTNDDGLRTSWTSTAFRASRQRIAVMGDSFVFGLGVGDDKTTSVFLERILRDRLASDDIAVLNAGVISYSPLLERSAFRHVVANYNPTLTLLLLDLGDVGDDYKYAASILPDSAPDDPRFRVGDWPRPPPLALGTLAAPILEPLRVPGRVFRRLAVLPERPSGYRDFSITVGGVRETDRWFILRHPLDETRPYMEATLSHVRKLAREVRDAGSDFVLVVVPRYFQWNDHECPKDWARGYEEADDPYLYAYFDFFDEARQSVDFPIISLLPAFQATTEFPLVLESDAHWNESGHRFVAETIANILLERGLVK